MLGAAVESDYFLVIVFNENRFSWLVRLLVAVSDFMLADRV